MEFQYPLFHIEVLIYTQFWKFFKKELGSKVNVSTHFHPHTDGQEEHTIHTLEDMLIYCVSTSREIGMITYLSLS